MNQSMHPVIADYVARHGITVPEPFRGRVTVVVDERYRVHLQAAGENAVAMICRLASLPAGGATRDQWLLNVGKLALGTVSMCPASCVIDPNEKALWLQHILTPGEGISLDESMGQFVNALSFWTGALPRQA
ncbi:type III secretion system chaperone [Bordetella sp. 15P40C-2]|uniref:type III secretion system chaperone n=1 Tax=Bordetella sp. 15P40C-2 TaxID=2572246 RepID=UPI001328AA4E|nr:type III secretion system chaperone [Bordetella sp. 15P40C-2]MVW70469.1 hypothetical protein [Bordetella sp. 15P40C-2]